MLETIGNSEEKFKPRIQRLITQYAHLKFGAFLHKTPKRRRQIGFNVLAT